MLWKEMIGMGVNENTAAQRLREEDTDSRRTDRSLKEVMGDKEYEAFRKMDPDIISDEELFE